MVSLAGVFLLNQKLDTMKHNPAVTQSNWLFNFSGFSHFVLHFFLIGKANIGLIQFYIKVMLGMHLSKWAN